MEELSQISGPLLRLLFDFTREQRNVVVRFGGFSVDFFVKACVMGMDVWGRNPSAPAGRYFRANIWSWRPIQALIAELCTDLVDQETMTKLGFNVGAGLADTHTCQQMANRFECWLEHHTAGHGIDLGLRVTYDGRFVSDDELSKRPDLETMSPYQVDDDHLKQWVEFLRHCGGFEVW